MCHMNHSRNISTAVKMTAKRPAASRIPKSAALLLLVGSSLVACCAGAYDFPIHRNLPNQIKFRSQQYEAPIPKFQEASRRSDDAESIEEPAARGEENEAQIRRLHQVVDSVAQLLNEEEQRENGPNRNHRQQQQHSDAIQKSMAFQAPELMSESAIRQAIEELEKVQQQERGQSSAGLTGADSRPSASISNLDSAGGSQSGTGKQATIESLIEELGDELIDDQLAVASQEAERLLRNAPSGAGGAQPRADSQKGDSASTSAPSPTTTTRSTRDAPALSGQLAAMDSESDLGSALANDFYAFHADPMSSGERAEDAANKQQQHQVAAGQNDLEAAAQTRNSVAQRGPQAQQQQPNPFNNNQDPGNNNFRFDFSQPAQPQIGGQVGIEAQQQRPPSAISSADDALIRAFRQQTGAAGDSQFPSSTLLPPPNVADNFWRPSGAQPGFRQQDDLGAQFNRPQIGGSLPPLPASRFQSLASNRLQPQGQHIHFTGHGFVASNDNNQQQFAGPPHQPPAIGQNQNQNRQPFSSTASPMISVLSGADTSGTNSVSWNPPPQVTTAQSQPPPQGQLFSQPFPSSTQASRLEPQQSPSSTAASNLDLDQGNDALVPNQFFPSVNPGQPSNFRSPFPSPQQDAQPQAFRQPQQFNDNQNNFVSSTEANNEFSTENNNRFQSSSTPSSPSVTTQWTNAVGPSQAPGGERDAADSQPRSSVRSLPNGQRFFSPNDLAGPTSTMATTERDFGRGSTRGNFAAPQTTTSTTTTTPSVPPATGVNSPTAAVNGTGKKDDMVIYYYYYYDDNKNATVVAKNVTTGAPINPVPLDAAIEADGGVEDTPYMDDPAPVTNVRTQNQQPRPQQPAFSTPPTTTTTTSTTTSSTTRASPSLSPFNSFEGSSNSNEERRFRNQNRNFERPASSSSRPPVNELASVSRSTVSSDRFVSTEPTVFRAQQSRGPSRNEEPTVPNSRLQSQLIANALGGGSSSASTQSRFSPQPSFSTTPSTLSSTTGASTPRVPLSNASRYGTTTNLSLDPYGLDPSAPANFAHSDTSVGHHNQRGNGAAQAQGHQQSLRRPTPVAEPPQPPAPMEIPDVPRNLNPTRAQPATQQFPSQRNQATLPAQSQRSNQQAGGRLNPVAQPPSPQPQQPAPSRQFFPESVAQPVEQPPQHPPARVAPTQNFRQNVTPSSIRQQPAASQEVNRINNLANSNIDELPDVPRGASRNNGRPSIPETGSTSGFARTTSTTLSVPMTSQRFNQQPTSSERPTTSVGTQPTVSTSVSRSFMTPQQVQVTTSVSPPTVTGSSVTTSMSMTTTSSSSATELSTTLSTTTPAPNTSSSSSAGSTQETGAPSTEAPASSSSTRRIFGNRNNRFQTRLTASARSTTTTTSTTPSPAVSSTTRRPTTSTTRKSSRQLFSGRNRLPSSSASSGSNNNSTESSVPTSSVARSRFGNNFTAARSRLTTAAPTDVAASSAAAAAAAARATMPQRATFKPRLPFMKNNKPASTSAATEDTNAPEVTSGASSPPATGEMSTTRVLAPAQPSSSERPAASSEITSNELSADVNTTTSGAALEETDMVASEKETGSPSGSGPAAATAMVAAPVEPALTTTTTTTTTQAPADQTGRNKPRRPLFASRQRNASLFGNRRNSTATA